jgi:membrane-associated phospholipid phosphatase
MNNEARMTNDDNLKPQTSSLDAVPVIPACSIDRFDRRAARSLLQHSASALAVTGAAVAICYVWVDRSVAFFIHRQQIDQVGWVKWLTLPPPTVQTWSPLVLAVLAVRAAWSPWNRAQKALFVACLSLIVADECRESLAHVFGRYWPNTWHDHNPSLIGTGAYGFAPFQSGNDVSSFPSGHAARIAGFLSVFWIAFPRGHVACLLLALPMLAALVGMNYHFVSDVIAGATLGAVVGSYATGLSGLKPSSE